MPKVRRKTPIKNHIQSILFDKQKYTKQRALRWLKKHNMYSKVLDKTEKYYRFRQYNPNKKFLYRTIKIGKDILFIYAIKKNDK